MMPGLGWSSKGGFGTLSIGITVVDVLNADSQALLKAVRSETPGAPCESAF